MSSSKTNVLIYGLPNASGGGYSVLVNLYEDFKVNADKFPDIHWHFIMGAKGLESTKNITVYDEEKYRKNYVYREFFNRVVLKRIVKENDIKVVISLNMIVGALKLPSIISFHNVLPLYKCGFEVFDKVSDIVKQSIINHMIVRSLKKTDYVIIPSEWIKKEFIEQFGINKEKICISPIGTPEMGNLAHEESNSQKNGEHFIFPASRFPYKNHAVIVEAVKLLKADGISGYDVKLTGNLGNGKYIERLKKEVENNSLPIEFSGLYSKEQLAKAYKEGVLIFPSKIETDGFPLLESMACGGRILAANLPYATDALKNYKYCKFFEADDAKQLASLMKEEIENMDKAAEREAYIAETVPRSEIIVPLIRKIVSNR